jgi:hypothetical protein
MCVTAAIAANAPAIAAAMSGAAAVKLAMKKPTHRMAKPTHDDDDDDRQPAKFVPAPVPVRNQIKPRILPPGLRSGDWE